MGDKRARLRQVLTQALKEQDEELKRLPGRPTLLSEGLVESVEEQVRGGLPILQAALVCGVPRRSHYNYMRRGREEQEAFSAAIEVCETEEEIVALANAFKGSLYWAYFHRVTRANNMFLGLCTNVIAGKVAEGDADLALRVLERRDPENWRPHTAKDLRLQNHDGTGNAELSIDLSNLSPEQLGAVVSDEELDGEFEDED